MGSPKYPECDLCPSSDCDDEKLKQVLDDPDFTKTFVNNMLVSNIDEISKDCYFMSEVISDKTDPMGIADFAFCIFVTLSQLVEMPRDKRMEIAVIFRQEFDRMAEDVSQGREIAKKKVVSPKPAAEKQAQGKAVSLQASPKGAPAKPPPPQVRFPPTQVQPEPRAVPAKPLPEPGEPEAPAGDSKKFLDELDQDIAEIDAISGNIEKIMKSEVTAAPEVTEEPEPKPAVATPAAAQAPKRSVLEPVIGKLAGRPTATGVPAQPVSKPRIPPKPKEPTKPREPERGSKANPIKLTAENLAGIVSDKDMARIEKGIKIRRIDPSKFAPKVTAPPQLRDASAAGQAVKPARLPEKVERVARSTEKEKALSQELFSAFQQIKSKDQLPNTFTLESLGVGETPEEATPDKKELEKPVKMEKPKEPTSAFLVDLFRLTPEETVASQPAPQPQPKPVASPVGDLTLNFGEETKPAKAPAAQVGKVEGTKTCPSCKATNAAKNTFCSKCGAKL